MLPERVAAKGKARRSAAISRANRFSRAGAVDQRVG